MEIRKQIMDSIRLKQIILDDKALTEQLTQCITWMTSTFRNGGKVLFCGNGGSAADAQHLSAELSGRFYMDRPPLPSEALHVNSSFVTATANDHAFERVFERMIQAIGKEGDILVALSTSGASANIIRALEAAKTANMKIIGMTGGSKENPMAPLCDILLRMPSTDTARVQELHMLLGHIICENVESQLFTG
ncbi:MAG: SIS domain-containing protein [Bacteroidia bacterium]|nr:MAG: SIS domain-containing protein [Bacteroidia bacterium]